MFKWQDSFSSKVNTFDDQHKKLFSLGNHLLDVVHASREADHYDDIIEALNELKDYTVYHFNAEEELMEKYNYPKMMSHKMQHKKFLAKVEELLSKDVDANQIDVTLELLTFLADWIQNHILVVDSQYGDFFNEKGEF